MTSFQKFSVSEEGNTLTTFPFRTLTTECLPLNTRPHSLSPSLSLFRPSCFSVCCSVLRDIIYCLSFLAVLFSLCNKGYLLFNLPFCYYLALKPACYFICYPVEFFYSLACLFREQKVFFYFLDPRHIVLRTYEVGERSETIWASEAECSLLYAPVKVGVLRSKAESLPSGAIKFRFLCNKCII